MTSKAVRDQLTTFIRESSNSDGVLLYFAGHGEVRHGELFLVLEDTDPADYLGTALLCRDIILALKFSTARNKILVLDCCNAGAGAKGLRRHRVPVREMIPGSESFQVLAASEVFEETREHPRWQGSFLSAMLVKELQHPGRSLADVAGACREAAQEHNSKYPDESISIPVLVGEQSGMFLLSLPRSKTRRVNKTFSIEFTDFDRVDMNSVLACSEQFEEWSPDAIGSYLPVKIVWPLEYRKRLRDLKRMRQNEKFPTKDPRTDPKPLAETVDHILRVVSDLEQQGIHLVRSVLSSQGHSGLGEEGSSYSCRLYALDCLEFNRKAPLYRNVRW